MAVILSFPSQPTWEDLFKILIKVNKLKKSTETILVFDYYTDELKYSLKDRIGVDRLLLYKHILVKQVKKCPKVKIIKSSCQTPKTNLSY